jgi:5-methyltetrahydropteroyltriglutamate--homocysteine methyltransferase
LAISSNLGFPRMGRNRELKKALENFWAGVIPKEELLEIGEKIRFENWILQKEIGIQQIPSNDFSFYDHMLDMVVLLGAVPARFNEDIGPIDLETYFAMAQGAETGKFQGLPPLEMTKWFNTNYHYLVPEISPNSCFQKNSEKIISESEQSKKIGIKTKPVVVGPLSFLLLSKSEIVGFSPIEKIDQIVPVYKSILEELVSFGVEWIQMDEPCLVQDMDDHIRGIYQRVFNEIGTCIKRPKIILTTYFDSLENNLPIALDSPFEAIHLDLTTHSVQLESALKSANPDKIISLGIVNGRNVWKTDFQKAAILIRKAAEILSPDRIMISPSCSLLHVPQDLNQETKLIPEVGTKLAFGKQKLDEIVKLTQWVNEFAFKSEQEVISFLPRHQEPRMTKENLGVKEKIKHISQAMMTRKSSFPIRKEKQNRKLKLPLLPITTIGSFPQTKLIRNARKRLSKNEISETDYENFIKKEIVHTLRFQEEIGVDVLVHGEFERNDMVQYFAEQMDGIAFTQNGWVQSFGSRYVRPPIIYGDVSRPKPMTVGWSRFAQSQTTKPVKGMLTGPITILNWSYVRDNQPIEETCRQIALAIRDEVSDLEEAGIGIIQIDEPAMREGLPLHRKDWDAYLTWSVECFKICTGGVKDETQIHTHMCYSEFNDIIQAIAALDADVISIEAARSRMELLKAFSDFQYPNDIGPGVYDIHSPHIPSEQEIYELLKEAIKVLSAEQIWVNPDCGLKTRLWEEVEPALKAMVAATRQLRKEIQASQAKG